MIARCVATALGDTESTIAHSVTLKLKNQLEGPLAKSTVTNFYNKPFTMEFKDTYSSNIPHFKAADNLKYVVEVTIPSL